MSKNKVHFILDNSEVFLDLKVREKMSEWGFNSSDYKRLTEWKIGSASEQSLFSSPKAVHLNLNNKKDLKKFTDTFLTKKAQQKYFDDNWFGVGVIITSTAKSAKKIEDLIKKSNGTFEAKRKPEEVKQELIDEMKISPAVANFLSDYVGLDYDLLLNIYQRMKKLTKEERKTLTYNDVILYLPFKKGTIPPWEFIDPLLQNNLNEAMDKLDRALENTVPLVLITLLKNKIELVYHDSVLRNNGIYKLDDKAKALKLPSKWALLSVEKMKNKPSLEVAEKIAIEVYNAENELKGGSSVSPDLIIKNLISKIHYFLITNKTI